MIPVVMAAVTRILGMAPLLQDAFFIGMAVTVMFGLGFATILTLVATPAMLALPHQLNNLLARTRVRFSRQEVVNA